MTQVNNFIFVNMKANLKYRLTLKEKNMYSWSTLFLFKAFDYVVTILTKSLIQVFLISVRCVDQQYEKAPRRFKLCFCNLQSLCQKDAKSFGIKVVLQQKKNCVMVCLIPLNAYEKHFSISVQLLHLRDVIFC